MSTNRHLPVQHRFQPDTRSQAYADLTDCDVHSKGILTLTSHCALIQFWHFIINLHSILLMLGIKVGNICAYTHCPGSLLCRWLNKKWTQAAFVTHLHLTSTPPYCVWLNQCHVIVTDAFCSIPYRGGSCYYCHSCAHMHMGGQGGSRAQPYDNSITHTD